MHPTASQRISGVDWAIAAMVATLQVGNGVIWDEVVRPHVRLDAWGCLLLLLGAAALVGRRVMPWTCYLCVVAATVGYVWRDYIYGPTFFSAAVAFVSLAVACTRWCGYLVVPACYLTVMWWAVAASHTGEPVDAKRRDQLVWTIALIAVAEGIRQRRRYLDQRAATADAVRRSQEALLARRISEQRLALARELHDLLGHSLTLIHLRASVALAVPGRARAQAEAILGSIRDVSHDALTDVASLIGAIRRGSAELPRSDDTIADVERVVGPARTAGLTVRVETSGVVRPLPSQFDTTAVRIVQESLTNIAKYAAGAEVTVSVHYADDGVHVEVRDTGGTVVISDASARTGIDGMASRAESLGGRLTVSAVDTGGFTVRAWLPAARSAQPSPATFPEAS